MRCGNIGLHNLFSSKTIISQETRIRDIWSNLNPFDEHSDEEMIVVLKIVLLNSREQVRVRVTHMMPLWRG